MIKSNSCHAQANTIGFGLLELARNPELQKILRAEIHSVVGAAVLGNIAYDRMPMLNAFIKVRVPHLI
jgi:cytochrome P450